MSLADFQDLPEAGVGGITNEEREKIRAMKFPGHIDYKRNQLFYPRKPKEDVNKWMNDYYAKLRSLEKAEGM